MSISVSSRVGYLIKQVQHSFRSNLDRELKTLSLSTAQYAVLVALQEAGAASGAELARRCFVTPQTITSLISGLEGQGYIIRKASTQHGRIIEAELTRDGIEALKKADIKVKRLEEIMLHGISISERKQIAETLTTCFKNLSC